MITHRKPRYLTSVRYDRRRAPHPDRFPFNIPSLQDLRFQFTSPMTFLIGENGSGKSTLIEALASSFGLPPGGGGRSDLVDAADIEPESDLTTAIFRSYVDRAPDAYFFRAELLAHFSTVLEERERDPDFMANPYWVYGGQSLHTRSHGEAFLAVLENRLGGGLYFMDEPESALSPQRQLHLLAHMADLVRQGDTQFVIATHSPILLTFPGATLLSLDDGEAKVVDLEDTAHFQLTRDILAHPKRYWQHLAPEWFATPPD